MIDDIVEIFEHKKVYDKLPFSQIILIVYYDIYFPNIEKLKRLFFTLDCSHNIGIITDTNKIDNV